MSRDDRDRRGSSSRRPDYDVSISRKRGEKYINTRVGAAWAEDGGRIAIRLEPGIAVSTSEGVFLTLWPKRDDDERDGGRR